MSAWKYLQNLNNFLCPQNLAKMYILIIIIFISELKNACSIIHSILSKDIVAEDLG